MSSLTILGDTSGSVVLQAPAVSGSTTITLAAQSGTLNVGGPAFAAYVGTLQSISSGVWTKAGFNTKVFDTANCYDTTNFRFTPTAAGYYQVSIAISLDSSGSATANGVAIYKNGTAIQYFYRASNGGSSDAYPNGAMLVYLNGSTDYIEPYALLSATSPSIRNTSTQAYFSAAWVRGN